MHSIQNSSKHDSISMFNIKSHQELMGVKRDLDFEFDFQHQYQNDNNNQTNYGGIFKGEKIDPKINNSELLINSMVEEQITKNNSRDQNQFNNNMQDLQSPVILKDFDIISPQNTQSQKQNKYQQSNQDESNNRYQNKQTIKVIDSQYDFNIKSNEQLNRIELQNKSSFEEQIHDIQSEKTQQSHLEGQFNQKLQKRTSVINNLQGVSSPFRQENSSQLNGKGVYGFQNGQTDETSNQNLHLAQRMSRNPSFRIDLNSMIGSQKVLNKNHTSNLNIGQMSEIQHNQKSEYKKNSIATLNTKQKAQQLNIYNVSIFCLRVIKFAKNLFYFSQRQQFKLLNQMKMKIIGDSASFFKYFYYSGKLKQKPSILEVVKYKMRQIVSIRKLNSLISRCLCSKTEVQFLPDFDEGSKAKIIWDIFLLLVTIFNIFTSPLRHSFEAYQNSLLTTNFISTIFAIDMLLQFRTSYFENGLIISKKSMIVMNYLKGKFISDFLGLIIFIFSYTFEDLLFMSYLMIYRFISVRKIFSDMENKFQLREKGLAYSTFIQLILSILLVSHYSASIFHYLAQVQHKNGVEQTWLILQTSYDSPWLERYIISLYWSVITIITIGYGDITPRTIVERTYVIVFAFVGCGLFGYCINVIGEQVREIGREKSIFKRKSAKLNKFMHMRALNKDLQQKVRKYYEYLFQEEMNEEEEGSNVFNNLTSLLKKQVWIDVYGKLLQQNKIFSTNFSNEFINMLSLKVKEKKFGPEEYIFVNGDSANYIFIIISGEVDQYLQRETIGDQYESLPTLHFINSYKKGEMFGQLEFFSQTKRKSTLKTKCVTSVAYLNQSDFLETLDKFELDKEVYHQIKDQINIYKNYSNIDLKCPICSEYRHRMHECNSINFILYKEKLIDLAQKSEIQIRQDKSLVNKEKLEYQKKNKTQHSFRMIETFKKIPLRREGQKKIAQEKYNAYVNNFEVKTQGFKIIVDILAEQIKETLSKEEEETILHQQFGSSEIKEAESQIHEDVNPQKQEEISVSEDQYEEGSSFQNSKPLTLSHTHFQNNLHNLDRRRSSCFSQKQMHVEVSAEQEESMQNMTSINRDSRKCKTIISCPKSSQKSLQHQDSDRRIQICRSQQKIDYTYALQSEVNLFYIPQAYVEDGIFNFPEDIVAIVCGKNYKTVQFQGSPTKYQNQISANSQYNKQQSKNSDLNSQVSSSNSSISPTIFQPLSLRHIDSKIQYPNINSSSYSNTNSFNNPSPFPISPVSSQYKNFSQNTNNSANLNQINAIRTNTAYSLSPSNTNCQTNGNSMNSFGTTVINLSTQQQQQMQDYSQMITQNPFTAQYNQPNSPYNNRLGTYGIYLPALQQLEPINEILSKEIISSSSEENNDEDITPARKSEKGSKVLSNQPLQNGRRQSKEPSIKLHVKQKDQQSSCNSQFIGSNGTIGYHHMEAISPMKIEQPPSQESIQIQRGFSSEQDTINQEDKLQSNTFNHKPRIPSSQHVQFAEDEDEILQNNSGGTLNNQNTLQSFEQAQQNIKNSQKPKKSKRSNHKPSKFSNNQYTYNSFVSQMSLQNQQKTNLQNLSDQQKNILFTRSFSQQNLNQINNSTNNNNNNNNNIFNQYQNNNFQGSGTILNSLNCNNNNNMNNNILNNAVANFQQQMLGANNGFSSQFSWQYDPSSLYSKLMSRQSVQMKFKKDQDYCALIYKKKINLKGIDDIYEEVYNNFDSLRNYTIYFWHNNFSYISQTDKQKLFRKKYHSQLVTTKLRKQSKTNEINQNKNTNRTSVQLHLARANTNAIQQQSTIRTSNRLSQASTYQNPQLFNDNKFGKNKIIKL
ncbi:hypothetical protein ABPG72_012301 [Tetrahymena utriculariae]